MNLKQLQERLDEPDSIISVVARLRVATGIRSNFRLFEALAPIAGVTAHTILRQYQDPKNVQSPHLLRTLQLIEMQLCKKEGRTTPFRKLTNLLDQRTKKD